MTGGKRLQELRNALKKQGVNGFILPVQDEYLSEYPPEYTRRLEWLTGFTGSAGSVAVLNDKAAFFTDGRYTLQASAELDAGLYEIHNISNQSLEAWLATHACQGDRIGYDSRLHTRDAIDRMLATLSPQNVSLTAVDNPIDSLWQNRPAAPDTPVFAHALAYSGESSADKRARVGLAVAKAGAHAALLIAADSINWLLNIRAQDSDHAPLALSTAIIGADGKVRWFITPSRCDEAVRAHLGPDVSIESPSALASALQSHKSMRILCDTKATPVWHIDRLVEAGAIVVDGRDPCALPKAIKNEVELEGMRNAHMRDGAAVVKLLCWLDKETARRSVRESEVCDKLLALRAANNMFRMPSFPTISGSGPNGAIVHYRVTPQTDRSLQDGELFLLDSGGQYPDGTTDITRTVPVGAPSAEHKDRFTRVLKGHIAIATARFPESTAGSQLDALARASLWQGGFDYDHGTGHGVGAFLNVHEGPQRISKRGGDAALVPRMVVSNEPGYYKNGEYGIRIENLVAVVDDGKGHQGKNYFAFETITCAPIDTRLVDVSMLAPEERRWLNEYHAWVQSRLSDMLDNEERAWLFDRCRPV